MIKDKNWLRPCALIFLIFLLAGNVLSQSRANKYPHGYFGNPLGMPMALSANFGELRPGHWHMGFDLRTNQKENYPVFAAAEGYVSYVGVRTQSFGKFIIIEHPNGYSTLYAHLNEFFPELENYVREKQKEKESWTIELEFPEKLFQVNKGDTIAKSGNTGGSQGPHLHFEIIDTKTRRSLNPQLFGFDIKDGIAPVINRLAIYDRSISTYLQAPQVVNVKKTDSGYFPKPHKIVTGYKKISFAIGAHDLVNGSSGANGIYGAMLSFDNIPQISFMIDSISYAESDYINAHIDRKYKNNGGPYLQHLSRLPGFKGRVYYDIEGNGIIELSDTNVHHVSIDVFDTEENLSTLFFQVQYNDSLAQKIKRNAWVKQLIPGNVNVTEEKEFEVFMPENSLYDTVPFIYNVQNNLAPGAVSALHRFGDPVYPVHENFTVRIKPNVSVSDKEKILIVREWQGNRTVKKAVWQKDWLSASFGDFGNFQAFVDLSPPTIKLPVKEKDTLDFSPLDKIILTPIDNFGIRSFRAELNGEWMMFSNDKGRDYVFVFDKNFEYGVYELKIKVEDLAGNITEKTWWFKRNPYTPPPKKKPVKKKKTVSKKPGIKK